MYILHVDLNMKYILYIYKTTNIQLYKEGKRERQWERESERCVTSHIDTSAK